MWQNGTAVSREIIPEEGQSIEPKYGCVKAVNGIHLLGTVCTRDVEKAWYNSEMVSIIHLHFRPHGIIPQEHSWFQPKPLCGTFHILRDYIISDGGILFVNTHLCKIYIFEPIYIFPQVKQIKNYLALRGKGSGPNYLLAVLVFCRQEALKDTSLQALSFKKKRSKLASWDCFKPLSPKERDSIYH